MEKAAIHRPVRYGEIAGLMSRPTFAKYYRKVAGSIYLHRDRADDPDLVAEALLMRCPHGLLRGFAALSNMGFTLNVDGWTPIISIPRKSPVIRAHRGAILRLVEEDVHMINGRRTVAAVQAVVDILTRPDSWGRYRDGTRVEEQVAVLDHLVRQNLELFGRLRRDPRTAGISALVNPLAESRPESIVRVRLHRAGFKEWKPQIRVRGREGFYFVDLGDPVLKVGIEYQGAHHFDREARARDAQRANDLRWAGWTILEVTSTILNSETEWRKVLARVGEEVSLARQQRNSRIA